MWIVLKKILPHSECCKFCWEVTIRGFVGDQRVDLLDPAQVEMSAQSPSLKSLQKLSRVNVKTWFLSNSGAVDWQWKFQIIFCTSQKLTSSLFLFVHKSHKFQNDRICISLFVQNFQLKASTNLAPYSSSESFSRKLNLRRKLTKFQATPTAM